MTNFKKLAVTFGVLLTFAVPTVATAAQVGGGTWHFGVGYTGTYGYSNYYHPSRSHTPNVTANFLKLVIFKFLLIFL